MTAVRWEGIGGMGGRGEGINQKKYTTPIDKPTVWRLPKGKVGGGDRRGKRGDKW